jgi:hypothetical protein
VLGPVRIENVHHIEPVWRPLVNALYGVVQKTTIRWEGKMGQLS